MTSGKFNMYLGIMALLISTFAGFALGNSLDQYFQSGHAQIPLWRYLTKAGHTHGMPFGLINIIFGLIIAHAAGSDRLKTAGAVLTALSLLLPVGVALRGLTEGAKFAEGIAMAGGFSFIAACVTMILCVRSSPVTSKGQAG